MMRVFIFSTFFLVLLICIPSAQAEYLVPFGADGQTSTNPTYVIYPPSSSIGAYYRSAEDICKLNTNISGIYKLVKDSSGSYSWSGHPCGGPNNFELEKGEGYFLHKKSVEGIDRYWITLKGNQEISVRLKLFSTKTTDNISSIIFLPEKWNGKNAEELCNKLNISGVNQLVENSYWKSHPCGGPNNFELNYRYPTLIHPTIDQTVDLAITTSPTVICTDSDNGKYPFIRGKTFITSSDSSELTIQGFEDYCLDKTRLKEGYCDGNVIATKEFICENGCLEGACLEKPARECSEDKDCPQIHCITEPCPKNICKDYKCVVVEPENPPRKTIYEKISCVFKGSKSTQNCHKSGGPIDEINYGLTWCKAIESCDVNVKTEYGEKITWKSSCGGYQYTVQDGNNEIIFFDCLTGEKNLSDIYNKGFRNAYWRCYSGEEWKSETEECKSAEKWKDLAINYCNSLCKDGKCGVNSFSISEDCYIEDESKICGGQDIQKCCENLNEEFNKIECVGRWHINNNKCEYICDKTYLDEKIQLICKDACPLEGKCYQLGYRKSDKYCSDSGSFVLQMKGEEKCENNFECKSNVCINNKCVSQGLVEKILNWFKKLFMD